MKINKLSYKNTEVTINSKTFNIHKERYANLDTFYVYEDSNFLFASATYDGALYDIKKYALEGLL